MPIDLGTSMVKGLYNKSTHWMGPKVAAPLPPADNMPWGPMPQTNPAYIDPRMAPNTAGFPLPRGPSLPQGIPPGFGQAPQQAPMPVMAQTPLLTPQPQPPSPSRSLQKRGSIGRPRKAPNQMPPDARPTAKGPGEAAGDALLRMMHGERRGGGGTV